MSKHIKYVLGFFFRKDEKDQYFILLMDRKKPDWQQHRTNGIGGKIKIGEPSDLAMQREFYEETEIITMPEDWTLMLTVAGTNKETNDTWEMDIYYCLNEKLPVDPKYSREIDEGKINFHLCIPPHLPHTMDGTAYWACLLALDIIKGNIHPVILSGYDLDDLYQYMNDMRPENGI